MLVNGDDQKPRSAVHFVFVREKVRRDYIEPVPGFSQATFAAVRAEEAQSTGAE